MERGNVNVLIYGGLGFIGWSLARFLLETNKCNINILDKKEFTGSFKHDNLYVLDKTKTQNIPLDSNCDIENFYTDDGMYIEKPHVIFHFAEYSRVEKSLEGKNEFKKVIENNTVGTTNVLLRTMEFAKDSLFFYAGSSTRFSLDKSFNQSPYAFSKYSNAELVKNLSDWFGLKTAVLYFYNVFGEGENAGEMGTVIEKFRRHYLHNEQITVYGGEQTRRFTYIGDVVRNIARLMFSSLDGGTRLSEYHMVSDLTPEISIMEVANMFYQDKNMIKVLPKKAGCRERSISQGEIGKVNTYGSYHVSLEEYINRYKIK